VEASSTPHAHASQETLEEYVFGRLTGPALESLETHLLLCSSCRNALSELEDYVQLMKAAALRFEKRKPSLEIPVSLLGVRISRPLVLPLLAMLFAGTLFLLFRPSPPAPPPAAVSLTAFRGVDLSNSAHAASRHPLDLLLDPTGLPTGQPYRVELVTAFGDLKWSGLALPAGEKMAAHVNLNLPAGVYWVRLRSQDGRLQREFGLRLD